jgi:hypothetical protein
MLVPKTVFVVGAGASFEFNLPVGNELKEEIASGLNFSNSGYQISIGKGDGYLYEVLQTYKQYVNRDVDFERLINAGMQISSAMKLAPSIDNFIHVHNGNKEIELCGKIAIAHRILRAEAGSKLRFISSERSQPKLELVVDTWLVALMKLIGEDCTIDQLPERLSNICFIVFNYDRCIEQFLFHAIQIYYGVSKERAAELVNGVAIYHPYGVVGKLPWQENLSNQQAIGFGGSPSQIDMIKIASEIKTFTEGTNEDSSEILAIRRSMGEAHRIVFLGFAYHRLNIQLLLGKAGISKMSPRQVFGTAWKMSQSDTESIKNSLSTQLFAPGGVAIRNDIKCSDIFYEYSRALTFAY